jgi:signal transduction histidine kinase
MTSRILAVVLLVLLPVLSIAQPVSNESISNKADSLYAISQYDAAIREYLEVLRQAEQIGGQGLTVEVMLALSRCYYHLYDRNTALKWLYRSQGLLDKYQLDSLRSEVYYLTCAIYIEEQEVDSAEKYAFKAIELMQKQKDHGKLSKTYCTLVELHLNTSRDTDKIERMLELAETHAKLNGNPANMAFVESKKYNYAFFFRKDFADALRHVSESERLYRLSNNREAILNAMRAKAECLIMLKDTSAKTYMNAWFQFKDSVLQEEKAKEVAQFETLYETGLKEQENTLLRQQNELSTQQIRTRNITILLLVAVLTLSVMLGLLWLNKVNLARSRAELNLIQSQQAEKERIARDLHDNVGGQLSYIIHSLEGLHTFKGSKREALVHDLTSTARNITSSLRETIWAVSEKNIQLNDISDRLKLYARSLFRNTSTKIHFEEQVENSVDLSSLIGLNVYRMCQEILTNSFKHAKASEIRVFIGEMNEKVIIRIEDNGIGFNPEEANTSGYGLGNIKRRADESRVKLNLESESGKGTKYTMIV